MVDRPACGCYQLEDYVVEVARRRVPSLLERLDDRMTGSPEVLGGVLVLRRVATADVTAYLAQPEMHPGVPHLQTFLAAFRMRPRIPDQFEMRADFRRGHGYYSFPYQAVVASSSAASNCR